MKYFGKKDHFIIAEIASSHDGKISKLKKLTDFSLNTGADAVKFQIFKASKLLSINNPLYKEFKKIALIYINNLKNLLDIFVSSYILFICYHRFNW